MNETTLTLYIDLQQGDRMDLAVAAKASLAWVNFVQAVSMHIDPDVEWEVELESALPGSQKIKTVIKFPTGTSLISAIRSAVVIALLFLVEHTAGWVFQNVLDYLFSEDAPPQVSHLSEESREELARDVVTLLNNHVADEEAAAVYDELKEDPKVQGAGATANPEAKRPAVVLPRESFPSRLPSDEDDPIEERTRTEERQVILERPVLSLNDKRKWGLIGSDGNFSASVKDMAFLERLSEGTLDVPLQEGLQMTVLLEITEKKERGLWRPIDRAIIEVRTIKAPPHQERLDLDGPQ